MRYAGKAADYRLGFSNAGIMVEHTAGSDRRDALLHISRITFADKPLDLEPSSDLAALHRLYDAAFNRTADEAGLGFWKKAMDNGLSRHEVTHFFVDSPEFAALYGKKLSNSQLVTTTLYQNILDRTPDAAGLDFWVDVLDAGHHLASVIGVSAKARYTRPC